MLVIRGTVGDELEGALLDIVKMKNPGKFNTDAQVSQFKHGIAKATRLEDGIKTNTLRINANTAQIIKHTTNPTLVTKLKAENLVLAGDSKTKRTQVDTILKMLSVQPTTEEKVKFTKIEERVDADGVTRKYAVGYSGTNKELSRTPVQEESVTGETDAQRIAREKKEADEAEAARIAAEEAARITAEEAARIAAGDTDTTGADTGRTGRLSLIPKPKTKITEADEVVEPEEPDTVLDTVAKETMTGAEKTFADLDRYKPKDLTKVQLQRIAQSGELSNEQLKAIAEFLKANAGKKIKPARNNKALRQLISVIYSNR